ncbi:MAG: S8 family serine peptidase [Bifidobacteriaceae bacterium]|jgi:subtilisin family serine protease|nr:S8 family serine peptidase [Bifidobacteriaceae bacterium]
MFHRPPASFHFESRRTGRRNAAVAAALAFSVVAAAVTINAAGSQEPAAANGGAAATVLPAGPAAQAGKVSQVRLITGDVVRLSPEGKVLGIEPGPRADGSRPQFLTRTADSHTLVVPSDVVSLIGDSLDLALFDVTELASYELGPDASVPVIIQSTGGRPDLSELGFEAKGSLAALPAQFGVLDAVPDAGPAPSWSLIEAVADPDTAGAANSGEPAVEKVWLDRVVQVELPVGGSVSPTGTGTTPLWMQLVGADVAKAGGLSGTGIKVAVVDTGVDSSHPDLVGQVVAAEDFTGLGSPLDEVGHGTFVASEIAGTGVASDGTYQGVAPGAKILNARVLDEGGYGPDSAILAGIEWAAQQGADVINLSLGDPGAYGDGESYFDQFVNQIVEDYGTLVVVAAGNDGGAQTVSTPAVADKALAVGATSETGNLAWFSSMGPRRGDGAVKPEVVAPGAGADGYDEDGNLDPWLLEEMTGAAMGTDGYTTMFGTSMAAPIVAGAAALLLQADPTLGPDDLRAKLMASAAPMPDDSTVFQQGAGLINIPDAIDQTVTTSPTQLNLGMVAFPQTAPVTQTLTYVNQGTFAESLSLDAGLTYSRYFGAPVNVTPEDELPLDGGDGGYPDGSGVDPLSPDHVTLSATTLTVPAGGTATVDVTVDPTAFGAGYVGGYVTATSASGLTVRTPIGLANEPEKLELTIIATDKDGEPIDHADIDFSLEVLASDFSDSATLDPVDGRASVELIAGDYFIMAYSTKTNAEGGTDDTVALSAVIGLDEATTVTLDGTTARPLTLRLPDTPLEGSLQVINDLTIGEEGGDEWSDVGLFSSIPVNSLAPNNLYVVPGAVDGTEAASAGSASLSQPLVEASLDACGLEPLPILDVSGRVAAGHSAFTLVDAADGEIPSSGEADQAVLVSLPGRDYSDESINDTMDLVAAAEGAGYGAVIFESDRSTVAALVAEAAAAYAGWEYGADQIAVLVTNDNGGGRLAAAAGGSVYLLGRGTLEYAYVVGQEIDLEAEAITLTIDESELANVTVQHRAIGEGGTIYDWFGGEFGSGGFSAQPGSTYNLHLSPGLLWGDSTLEYQGGLVNNFNLIEREYAAGEESVLTLGSQVHSAWIDNNYVRVTRLGDDLYAGVPLFVDGQGNPEWLRDFGDSMGYGATDLTLTDLTTGDVLFSNAADPAVYDFRVEGLDPSAHRYRLDELTTTDTDLWAWSTDVTASWEWESATPTEPDEWGDLIRYEPLVQAWFELPSLDAYNAGSTSQLIFAHVSQLAGSEPIPLESAALEASTDGGATWTPVPWQSLVPLTDSDTPPEGSIGIADGEAVYMATIEAAVGDVVSLRFAATAGSSSFEETVLNAYPVTDSPRGYLEPVSWNSCGVEAPLPLQVSTQVPAGFQAKGQSPDDAVTLSLAGQDAEWRADANGDPAVVKVEGTFYGGSKSAFTVKDSAPAGTPVLGTANVNVTLPTSGSSPVTVPAPAGFTVPTSQYGTWVWKVTPDGQLPAVRPLIPAGVADKFGQAGETVVTQMGPTIQSRIVSSAQSREVCDKVWLEPGTAGDLWLDRQDGAPVKVAVNGALYKAATAGTPGTSTAGATAVKDFELTFTAAGQDHAQTVCHTVPAGQAAYSFQFRIDLNRQAAADARYLSQGTVSELWKPQSTVVLGADGELSITGSNDLVPMVVFSLVMLGLGAALLGRSRRRAL